MESHDSDKQNKPKKLRFITTHGAPIPKRRRVSAACLTCRRRKVACSGERPLCKTCAQAKVFCGGFDAVDAAAAGPASQSGEKSSDAAESKHDSVKSDITEQKTSGPSSNAHPSSSGGAATGNAGDLSRDERSSKSPTNVHVVPAPPSTMSRIEEEVTVHRAPVPSLSWGPRNRMPYFRWLGPTAIMPGFKQMVVKINHQHTSNPVPSDRSNDDGASPHRYRRDPHLPNSPLSQPQDPTPVVLPFYDNSPSPPSELITHLVTTFFAHLACNFPFLQRDLFLKDLDTKEVDVILVDAVCALAARFSTHELLRADDTANGKPNSPSEQGSVFAQRAKNALLDTFCAPSVAAVQAALLLAYNEFGESRDSGLWMYLGIAIRLAQDLGMQKLDGLLYEGRDGPTPRMVDFGGTSNSVHSSTSNVQTDNIGCVGSQMLTDQQRAIERERVDTFWAVFFLDRVVSSGTGRRSTLHDKDIELSFPCLETQDPKTGWPMPFPALIRIVHLYGRVADLLNSIKEPTDITTETSRQLADMETRVTNFYQGLPLKLYFQATNFHHYVKAGEGTNFVLLHFWFHTLIVLLHQPTLLKTFEGKMLQLFPDSQQLSMSSAKTIADILSYSQLIDAKVCLGNPFTTQPIYIAACAFLKETAEQAASSRSQSRTQSKVVSPAQSRSHSPKQDKLGATAVSTVEVPSNHGSTLLTAADRLMARHTLLATAASQHYQLSYKALQSLETYWAGTKYILTVLDQKFKGVGDPLLYTPEEGESAVERPNPKAEEAFRLPGWRRKSSVWDIGTRGMVEGVKGAYNIDFKGTWLGNAGPIGVQGMGKGNKNGRSTIDDGEGSRRPVANQATASHHDPIGWTLTGTLNSPSTNLAWHFPPNPASKSQDQNQTEKQSVDAMSLPNFYFNSSPIQNTTVPSPAQHNTSPTQYTRSYSTGSVVSHRPQRLQQHQTRRSTDHSGDPSGQQSLSFSSDATHATGVSTAIGTTPYSNLEHPTPYNDFDLAGYDQGMYEDMLIESQDIDTSLLGLETMPWFEALPGHLPDIDIYESMGDESADQRSLGR